MTKRRRFFRRVRKRRAALLVFLLLLPTCRSADSAVMPPLDYATRVHITLPAAPGRMLSYLHSDDSPNDSSFETQATNSTVAKQAISNSRVRVIYIHGTPGAATQWKSYLRNPVASTISVAPDRLGFGGSQNAADMGAIVSFAEQAESLAPLLNDTTYQNKKGEDNSAAKHDPNLETKNILVGHSLGGPIIAWLAAAHPEQVHGIVIASGSLDPELESPRWYNYVAGFPLVRWLLPRDLGISNDEIMAAPRETELLNRILADVRCPVIIVHGAKDKLVPVANVDYMRRAFANAAAVDVRILPDDGHFIIWTRTDVLRELIRDLAARLQSDETRD